MIAAPLLEIAVLVLGMLILMIEAFAGKIDKRVLAFAAIIGLVIVLLASFFVAPFSLSALRDWLVEFLRSRPTVDFLQAIRAGDHDFRPDHDDRLRSGTAQFLCWRHVTGGSRRVCGAASFHLCRTDVPRFRNRLRFHLCLSRAGNGLFLRAH